MYKNWEFIEDPKFEKIITSLVLHSFLALV